MPGPINPRQAQLTVVLAALRALDFDPPEQLPTDDLLDEARGILIDVRDRLTAFRPEEQPMPSEQERVEWLEAQAFEQQKLGLR